MAETLTVVGASVRAAVQSAVRAGFAPVAGDLFADLDLERLASAVRVPDYPHGLARICAGPQPGGWMYTGGLENYPNLVEQLAQSRPLWGNSTGVLQRVRQPCQVARVLCAAGLACPEQWGHVGCPARNGDWLRKPRRSTGGLRISHYQPPPAPLNAPSEPASSATTFDPDWYFQRYIRGLPCAAVYLAAAGQALLLGVSEQLIGTPWLGSGGFRYSGSIGPLNLPARVRQQFVAVGQTLAAGFELIGLFGVDAVLAADVVWPVEINPRYTASVEVLERGYGWGAIAAHVETCKTGRLQPAAGMIPPDGPIRQVCGKAVLFARRPLEITDELSRSWLHSPADWPEYADVPAAGTTVPPDGPIVTLLASGADVPHVRRKLQGMAAAAEKRLYRARIGF
jgi:predicted ATP-grasp superfamily ATP-dependent carboligase